MSIEATDIISNFNVTIPSRERGRDEEIGLVECGDLKSLCTGESVVPWLLGAMRLSSPSTGYEVISNKEENRHVVTTVYTR